MRAVQRDLLGRLRFISRPLEDLLPDSALAPAIEAIVNRLTWAVFRRTVLPTTSGLDYMDDPAQNRRLLCGFGPGRFIKIRGLIFSHAHRSTGTGSPSSVGAPDSSGQPVES
jgi:hypothetical protein